MAEKVSETTEKSKSKGESFPPEGYVCNLCGVSGHWIQQCSQKPKKRKRTKTSHQHVPGVDPSTKDIEKARQMQQLVPPMCDCGQPSRLKKVKRSRVSENSRANGAYFFFCAKKRDDSTKCTFARPVQEELKSEQDKRTSNFFAKKRKLASGGGS